MKISQNLESFRVFAETLKADGRESAVIRATEASVFGSKRLQVSVAADDKAYAFFRSDEAKSANTRTRDIFFKTVAKEFGGEKFIPQSVMDAMTNFGGASNKPLTARRIVAICDAVIMAKSAFAQNANEVQPPTVAVTEAPTTRLLPEEPGEVKVKAPDMTLATFAGVVNKANNPSLMSGLADDFFSLFSAPKPKVFKIENGELTYEKMPDNPDPKTCRQIRKNLVDAIYYDLLTRSKLEMDVVRYIFDRIKSSLLDKSVENTPLRLDDPAVKDALKMTEEFKYGLQYNDSVSKRVVNRATLRLNPGVVFDKIVAPVLGKVLGEKNIALFSKAKATVDAEGYLSVTLDNARLKKEWSGLSDVDKLLKGKSEYLASVLKDQIVSGLTFKDLTLKIKPEYDAKTGAINLTVKVPTSTENSTLLKTAPLFKPVIENLLVEKLGTSGKQQVCAVPLSGAEKTDASVLMKLAVNLRHFGTTQLNTFGMNNSIAGNITDVKFTRNGMVVKFGDNSDSVENAGQIHEEEVADGNDLSLNVVPSAIAPAVEQLLRNKVGFTSMSMSTAAGRNGKAGTMKLHIRGLDIPSLTASKTGTGFAFLRKIGALQVSDVDIEIRPSLDPVSKRIRLDVTGFSGTGAVGGVRGWLARKLLSTVLPNVLGDIGGVGFVPGGDILSVTVDAQRFLAKVIPDPDTIVPGGIPAISEFSADENGFKIGVTC